MKILDMSAGNRAVWFDKSHRDCTYVDIRPQVKPDIVADTRELPAEVGDGFTLVVFDPPHVNGGANGNISRDYGHHTSEQIRDIVRRSAREAHRVTVHDALMAFKWNNHDQKLSRILGLMADWWEPLFGHGTSSRTKHASQTCWVMLRRRDAATSFQLAEALNSRLAGELNAEFDDGELDERTYKAALEWAQEKLADKRRAKAPR